MISIVTPSFNQLEHLKRCCASVADQEVPHEHIVVDGASTDGTAEWLSGQPHRKWISEPDRGMYDAINKGLAMAAGNLAAYLNCDEQYLPGTLAAVESAFARNPGADIVFGDALLVRPDGTLLAFRKTYPLRWPYIATSHLYALSCATFFRKTLLERCGGYDTSWRTVGDADLVLRALHCGAHAMRIPRYLAAFTMRDANLGASTLANAERRQLCRRSPRRVRAMKWLFNASRLVEKALNGAYRQSWPLDYALYTEAGRERTVFRAQSASFRWSP